MSLFPNGLTGVSERQMGRSASAWELCSCSNTVVITLYFVKLLEASECAFDDAETARAFVC